MELFVAAVDVAAMGNAAYRVHCGRRDGALCSRQAAAGSTYGSHIWSVSPLLSGVRGWRGSRPTSICDAVGARDLRIEYVRCIANGRLWSERGVYKTKPAVRSVVV